ncbi:LOW QUALITY PROTEIN: hypothetical protein V2J09_020480 [Rumex salicifolius]
MFQILAIPSHTQSLSFTANCSSISSFKREPHRPFSVRCRAAAPGGCLVASRNSTPASLYEVLRVKHNASPDDIKTAYRRLAKKYHPDAVASNLTDLEISEGSDFIQIHNAYETLSDPNSRAIYDRSISLVGRRMVARSAASTTPFSCYSSSSSSSSSSGRRPGFYPTRRWETDQCWYFHQTRFQHKIQIPSDFQSVSFPSTNHYLLTSTVNFPSRFKSRNPTSGFRCRSAVAPSEVSLYDVLGVRRNASPSEIKTAYRSLAKRYHPDANSTAPDEDSRRRCFVVINDAYQTLSDSDARAVYDSSIGLLGSNGNATSFGGGLSSGIGLNRPGSGKRISVGTLSSCNILLRFQAPTQSPSYSRHRSFISFPAGSVNPASFRSRAAVQDLPETAAALENAAPATLYDVLKVKRDASTAEVKAAYRTLAKLHHPDASDGSDGSDFIRIHQAYETLSDPSSRTIYDLTLRLGGRVGTAPSMSFGRDFVIKRRRPGYYPTRRWETDQCW